MLEEKNLGTDTSRANDFESSFIKVAEYDQAGANDDEKSPHRSNDSDDDCRMTGTDGAQFHADNIGKLHPASLVEPPEFVYDSRIGPNTSSP